GVRVARVVGHDVEDVVVPQDGPAEVLAVGHGAAGPELVERRDLIGEYVRGARVPVLPWSAGSLPVRPGVRRVSARLAHGLASAVLPPPVPRARQECERAVAVITPVSTLGASAGSAAAGAASTASASAARSASSIADWVSERTVSATTASVAT